MPFFLPWPQHQNGCNGSPAASYCTAIITQCSQQSRSCCCMQRKPNKVEVALRHVSGHIFAHLATRCLFHLLLQKLHIFPPPRYPRYCVHMQCQTWMNCWVGQTEVHLLFLLWISSFRRSSSSWPQGIHGAVSLTAPSSWHSSAAV